MALATRFEEQPGGKASSFLSPSRCNAQPAGPPHSPLGLFSTSTSMMAPLAAPPLLLPPLTPLLLPAMAACDAVKLERRYTCSVAAAAKQANTHQ